MKLKELEKRLKAEPNNLGLRVQVAGLLRESGRSIEAVEHYRSVALAYRDQGRTQQAIAVCRSILDIAPDDAACHGLLAMLQGRGTAQRPPVVVEPAPTPASPVRAATGGTLPEARAHTTGPHTPVKITEPVKVPSVPNLRPITKDLPPASIEKALEPVRRSSLDETPLPRPVPYHVHDPTSSPHKISARELDEKLSSSPNITSRTGGLAEAARRISGLISNDPGRESSRPGVPKHEMDISAELDTRQRPKIKSDELRKLTELPDPEETHPRDDVLSYHAPTRDPLLDDLMTEPVEALTPPPRGSEDLFTPARGSEGRRDYTPRPGDDLYTPPPRSSDDAITPPPLAGVVPPEVVEPPKSTAKPSRPPKQISIPPAGVSGTTKSVPPLGIEPIRPSQPLRPTPSLPPMKTGTPPPRSGTPSVPPSLPVVPQRPVTAPTRPMQLPERDSMAPTNPRIVPPAKGPTVPPPAKSPTVPLPAKANTVPRSSASLPPRGRPPLRPASARIPKSRDSDDELTTPRDKADLDDDE